MNTDTEFDTSFEVFRSKLNQIAEVSYLDLGINDVFSIMFVEAFSSDTPNYELSAGVQGATRSNWTYHTAMAISQSCKTLDLTCKFEAHGRRDAVVETREKPPRTILFAEWEWDYQDIFGKGKELDKLRKSCEACGTANGFLLTYSPESEYLDYLKRVAEQWCTPLSKSKAPPTLYLHTIIFTKRPGYRQFDRLISVAINPLVIEIWNEKYL